MKFLLAIGATGLAVTPTQKVIQMLSDMVAKGKQEKHDETVRFSEFTQWCQDTAVAKKRAIDNAQTLIEQMDACIVSNEAQAEALGQEIVALQGEVDQWTADQDAATKNRKQENKDFRATELDYQESIDALERAIVVLKEQSHDRKQPSLVQTSLRTVLASRKVPSDIKRVVSAYLSETGDDDFLSRKGPDANAYEFQSGGVVDMMEKLRGKFQDELRALQKEEMNQKHSFGMISQQLTDSIEAATKQLNKKSTLKEKKLRKKGECEGDKADASQAHAEDTKYLHDTKTECNAKAADFENRQTLRKEELVALNKAIEILSSGAVSGNEQKYVRSSFIQLHRAVSPKQQKLAMFLATKANEVHSRVLSLVASKAEKDPFVKVKKMIESMIVRLMEEANEEAGRKAWCDTELATNKATRTDKSESVDKLRAESDELKASISKLSQRITTLSDEIAEIDRSVAEATELRNTEKVKNEQTVKDAKEGQAAVASAIAVLREFYEKASRASSFVQGPAEDAPETFSESYKGQQASSGGVVGMLEVIESDFARLESETQASESQAQSAYDENMNDAEQDRAVKSTDLTHATHGRQRKEQELGSTSKDLNGTQRELEAAQAYYDELKASCIDTGLSYEERVAQRNAEIQSLKEALSILSSDDIA